MRSNESWCTSRSVRLCSKCRNGDRSFIDLNLFSCLDRFGRSTTVYNSRHVEPPYETDKHRLEPRSCEKTAIRPNCSDIAENADLRMEIFHFVLHFVLYDCIQLQYDQVRLLN